jgi:flagellar biosynthesis protein FlhB
VPDQPYIELWGDGIKELMKELIKIVIICFIEFFVIDTTRNTYCSELPVLLKTSPVPDCQLSLV